MSFLSEILKDMDPQGQRVEEMENQDFRRWKLDIYTVINLVQGLADFFYKGQIVNILNFALFFHSSFLLFPVVSFNKLLKNIKTVGPTGHNLSTSDLGEINQRPLWHRIAEKLKLRN